MFFFYCRLEVRRLSFFFACLGCREKFVQTSVPSRRPPSNYVVVHCPVSVSFASCETHARKNLLSLEIDCLSFDCQPEARESAGSADRAGPHHASIDKSERNVARHLIISAPCARSRTSTLYTCRCSTERFSRPVQGLRSANAIV